MDLIDGILSRQSIGALAEPAPSRESLDDAFKCAMAAPDHGRLRPWRFLLCEGEGRKHLGRLMSESMKRRELAATAAQLALEEARPLRAPLVVVAVCEPPATAKIPEIEQVLAVGAAVQNFCLALHAQGFGSIWRTGPAAYDRTLISELGFGASARLIGFIYVGTPHQKMREVVRPLSQEYVRDFA